ncbi:MAG: class I SAM-dependent methyltransferase [Thermoguttaceae bacterium]|nr:class I SAM-dependent methyltransferase [Thermoguttaceae bacterium]
MKRKERPMWQYDELKINSIIDYTTASEAAHYEERHSTVRNIKAENQNLLDRLEVLIPDGLAKAKILEIGTGTGAFARTVAPKCAWVTALDASEAMLAVAKEKAAPLGLTNMEWFHAGFLTFDFPENEYDAVVSSLALHHLPDVWKGEALANIRRTLKPGGVLILVDVTFPWDCGEMAKCETVFLDKISSEEMKEPFIGHLSKEYSTFSWIMAALIEHAGLKLLERSKFSAVAEIFVARK